MSDQKATPTLADFSHVGPNLCACVCPKNHPESEHLTCTVVGKVAAGHNTILLLCEACEVQLANRGLADRPASFRRPTPTEEDTP